MIKRCGERIVAWTFFFRSWFATMIRDEQSSLWLEEEGVKWKEGRKNRCEVIHCDDSSQYALKSFMAFLGWFAGDGYKVRNGWGDVPCWWAPRSRAGATTFKDFGKHYGNERGNFNFAGRDPRGDLNGPRGSAKWKHGDSRDQRGCGGPHRRIRHSSPRLLHRSVAPFVPRIFFRSVINFLLLRWRFHPVGMCLFSLFYLFKDTGWHKCFLYLWW